MVGYSCITCKAKTFRELWNKLLSANTAWLIDVIIFLNGWITLVCYIILIGDFMSKSFLGLLGPDHLLTKSRVLNQTVITAMVLLPLSLARDLHVLAYTSILGLGVLVYVVILVIHDSWMNSTSISHDTPLCEWNMGIFEAISLYTNAFVAHYNAPKVFAELANPTYERWTLLVAIAYGIAFAVYAEFAWAGFRRFEHQVQGNILRRLACSARIDCPCPDMEEKLSARGLWTLQRTLCSVKAQELWALCARADRMAGHGFFHCVHLSTGLQLGTRGGYLRVVFVPGH